MGLASWRRFKLVDPPEPYLNSHIKHAGMHLEDTFHMKPYVPGLGTFTNQPIMARVELFQVEDHRTRSYKYYCQVTIEAYLTPERTPGSIVTVTARVFNERYQFDVDMFGTSNDPSIEPSFLVDLALRKKIYADIAETGLFTWPASTGTPARDVVLYPGEIRRLESPEMDSRPELSNSRRRVWVDVSSEAVSKIGFAVTA